MNLLVFNCGSSSLNYKLYQTTDNANLHLIIKGKAHRVGTKGIEKPFIEHHINGSTSKYECALNNHQEAAKLVLKYLNDQSIKIDIIGHRFVHGGDFFKESVLLSEDNIIDIESCLPLAPIHNPNSWSVINECKKILPKTPQYLSFDTAFHSTLEPHIFSYALPEQVRKKYGLRRFGFHGLSYQYISYKVPEIIDKPSDKLKMIVCHLGTGGSSVAAIKDGKSVDTSMGFSPTAGLIMSTRCGDIDPMIPVYLFENGNYSSQDINQILNKQSGLLGVSEISSDIRDLFKIDDIKNNINAHLAIQMYSHQLVKYIGAYIAVLNGIDALVFTDDVGLQCRELRKMVCDEFNWYGIKLNDKKNNSNDFNNPTIISSDDSKATVIAVPTDEELMIGLEGINLKIPK